METEKISEQIEMSPLFVSHKQVKRLAMNRTDYNVYRGWELPADENGDDEGYLVEYLDGGKPNHPDHSGYISWSPKQQFDNGYTEKSILFRRANGYECEESAQKEKTLGNTDVNKAQKNVSDLAVFGDGDLFKLVSKASSQKEGWMKSTKVMDVSGGCVLQVTTQQRNPDGSYAVAEALTYIPGTGFYDGGVKLQG